MAEIAVVNSMHLKCRKTWGTSVAGFFIFSALLGVMAGKAASPGGGALSEVGQADANLNGVYQTVSHNLDVAGRSYLKTVERAWIRFKDRDFALFSRLSVLAGDKDAPFEYQRDAINAQSEALSSLGAAKSEHDPIEFDPDRRRIARTASEADQMLNSSFRECLTALPPEQLQQFKEIESLWIEYRDLYCKLDSVLKGGRVSDFVLRDITQTRVIQLRRYVVALIKKQLPVAEGAAEADRSRENSQADASLPDIFRFAR